MEFIPKFLTETVILSLAVRTPLSGEFIDNTPESKLFEEV